MAATIRRASAGLLALLTMLAPGCMLGPKAIERTHGHYGAAVQQVEEEQFLKNVVRLRYMETPRNLDVASIAAQYEIAGGAEARPFFSTEATGNLFKSYNSMLPFASISGANRPTVSLDPQDDASSIRQFLTPISPETLVFLSQCGWPVSSILRIWADRLNGVPNWMPPSAPARAAPTDFARFQRATELLQATQDRELISIKADEVTTELSDPLPADAVNGAAATQAAKEGFEYRRSGSGWVLVKREKRIVLEVTKAGMDTPEVAELAKLLNLNTENGRFDLVLASGVSDPAKIQSDAGTTLQLTPRSTAQALFFLANGVEVPPEHLALGLVHLPTDGADPAEATRGLFRVHVCSGHAFKRPPNAYTAIWYRHHWYYIDDRDLESKATMFLLLQLRRLDFQRQRISSIPALTLPVGR